MVPNRGAQDETAGLKAGPETKAMTPGQQVGIGIASFLLCFFFYWLGYRHGKRDQAQKDT